MTATLHICRHCDSLITDPDDGVLVTHEHGNNGPGWDIYAHREHAHLVQPDPQLMHLLLRIRLAKAARST
ncbi:hypothetical protein ACFS5L_27660 [Streptomyces phyllanthi]|uniref:Uncharacterized protein n=1 Tax=Streptomyces phyllanthi TaxID=1803180 RepID=A0A5N8VZV4_9ACTN|nr:hypothetical protein [Streptomyces phyllanthi]MPY40767.1 hypothetical protein [Streptomyces phyllanthi]